MKFLRAMTGMRRLILGLALLCAGLSAILVYQLQSETIAGPLPPAKPAEATVTVNADSLAPPATLASVATYDAIAKQPLFSPTRLPTEPPPPPRQAAPKRTLNGIVLTGVIIYPSDRIALVTSSRAKKPLRLREGDRLDTWKVESVRIDSIVLSAEDETAEISVWDKLKAARAQPKSKRR